MVTKSINRYFVTKYGVETRKEYAVATILDPRFKLAGFQMRENGHVAKHMVLSEMQITGAQDSPASPSSGNQTTDKGKTIWDKVFEDKSTSQDEDQELEDVFRNELQIHLKEKRNDIGEDPITYWKANSARFPHLTELVRRYHCAPPFEEYLELPVHYN